MKIQSKILLSVIASVAVAAMIALIAFSILRGMNTEFARIRAYDQIIGKTHALNILAGYLKEGPGQSDIRQVRGALRSLDDLLGKMTSQAPREEALIKQLQRNNSELGPLIDQMFVTGQGVGGGIEKERRHLLASQVWMKVKFISDDTNRLKDMSDSRIISAQAKAGGAVIVLIIMLALTNGIIYFLSGRSIVRGQEALRESEERLRVTLGSVGDAVIATDASGLVTFLNPVAAKLTGWESGAASHQPIQNVFRIINEQTRQLAENVVERVLREGNIVNLANHTALITRDGREIPIEDSAAPIRDKDGGVCGVVLVFHDVTERRRARQQIESIARFPGENPNPILRISSDGKLLYANRSSATLLESLGWKQGETLPGDWRQYALQTLGSGRSKEMELTCEEVVYSLLLVPVRDLGYLNIYGRDITERKRVEVELRESQARLDLALRSAQMGVWHLDLIENKRHFDDQVCHLLGIAPAKFTGTAEEFYKVVHPDDREMIRTPLARTIEQDVPYETEYRAVWPDGSLHYIISRAKLFRSEIGRPVRVDGLAWDITERKRMEEGLRKSEAKYRTLFENMAEEVHFWQLVRDEAGQIKTWRVVDANPPALKTWGWTSAEEIRGKIADEIYPGATDHYMPVVQKIMTEGVPYSFEDHFAGIRKYFRFTSVPLGDYFITTGADITSIKKAEQSLRKAHDELEARVRERTAELVIVNEDLQKQAALLDLSHDAILVVDSADVVSFWNSGAEDLYGFNRQQAIGNVACEFLQTRFPESFEQVVNQVIDKGHWAGELRQTTSSGKELVVESRWALRQGEDGKPTGFLEVNRDITSRKIVEERLRRADRAFRTLSECNQAIVRQAEEMELLRQTCRIVVEDGGYRMAWVGFAENDDNKTVRPVAHAGYDDGYLDKACITWADVETGRGPTGTAIRTGEISISKDALTNPAFAPWRLEAAKRGFASSIALPLIVDGQAVGALTIYAPEPDAFDEREVSFLSTLAENLAYGIASIRVAIQRRRSEEDLRVYAHRLEVINKELEDFAFIASHDL